ncbi:MAG TPA: hypothetical protein PKO28_02785 [Bacilli bacterium]|nr:hypothetical protein [Bacilli bacterium]
MKSILIKARILLFGSFLSIITGASLLNVQDNFFAKAQAMTCVSELDFTSKTVGHSSFSDTWTYDDWTIYGASNNNKAWAYAKFGGKKNVINYANPSFAKNNNEITSAIEKVDVSIAAGSLSKSGMSVKSWGVYVYSNAALTVQTDYVVGGTITSSAHIFEFVPTSGTSWSAGSYFKVSFNLKNTTNTAGVICVDKIQMLKITEVVKVLTGISISGDMAKKSYAIGGSWSYSGLLVTALYSDESTIDVTDDVEWLSDPTNPDNLEITSLYLIAGYLDQIAEITVEGISVTTYVGGITSGVKYLITATANDGIRYILKAGLFSVGDSADNTEVYSSVSQYSASDAWTFTAGSSINQWTVTGLDGAETFGLRHLSNDDGVASEKTNIATFLASETDSKNIFLSDAAHSRYLTACGGAEPDWKSYTSATAQGIGSQIILVEYDEKVLSSIAVTSLPTKVVYCIGDSLNIAGLVITGIYDDSSMENVTNSCAFSPSSFSAIGNQIITVNHIYSNLTTAFSVSVVAVQLASISVTNLPNKTTYLIGNSLITTGIIITGTYNNNQQAEITNDCTYSPMVLDIEGTQIITVTHTPSELTATFNVTVNQNRYYFGAHSSFAYWTSSYATRTLNYDDFTMKFSSAGKMTSVITNMPVSKGSYAIFTSKVLPIKSITFAFAQWASKIQNISLNKYANGRVPAGDVATTLSFPSAGTKITRAFSEIDVMSVKVTMGSKNNQIGWNYVSVEFYDFTNAQAFSTAFLSSITCDGGITPPSLTSWSAQANNYASSLGASAKYVLIHTVANTNGTIFQRCVARYDYIVSKYGDGIYSNFMSRAISQSSISSVVYGDYRYIMTALIVILLSSLGLTGALFCAKKKRESQS